MADKMYQPVDHDGLSRTGHAVGKGAVNGVKWGLAGMILGVTALIAAPFLAVSYGPALITAIGWSGLAYGAAGVGLAALVGGPVLMATGIGGALIGMFRGASNSADQTANEQAAYRYQAGYKGQMTALQGQLAAAVQEAQERQFELAAAQAEARKPSHHHEGKPHHRDHAGASVAKLEDTAPVMETAALEDAPSLKVGEAEHKGFLPERARHAELAQQASV